MSENILEVVQAKYGAVARSSLSSESQGVRAVAQAFGYSPEELASIPAEANMGLSCGNPTAFASLRPGETVVDLGSGGGLDVFLAAAKVGPTGKAIGIDMTPEMVERARQSAKKHGLRDRSVDCVISNCVINLAPDKAAVFRDILRVLKPGGRVAVSDIALKKDLPRELAQDLLAYVGCIAGAISISDYERSLINAGFETVQIVDTGKDLNAYSQIENQSGCCSSAGTNCCSPIDADVHESLADLLRRYDVNEYAASVQIYAIKAR